MKPRQYLNTFFLLIILIIVIGIFFFPISKSKLKSERESLIEIKLNQAVSILDEIDTEGSVIFLVTTKSNENYVIQAENFFGLGRYRLLQPISVKASGETFELRSFLSDLTITVTNTNMDVNAQMNILKNGGRYIIVLIVIPIIGVLQSIILDRETIKSKLLK